MPTVFNTANAKKVYCHLDGSRFILENYEETSVSKDVFNKFEHFLTKDSDIKIGKTGMRKTLEGKGVKAPLPEKEKEEEKEEEKEIVFDVNKAKKSELIFHATSFGLEATEENTVKELKAMITEEEGK